MVVTKRNIIWFKKEFTAFICIVKYLLIDQWIINVRYEKKKKKI